MESPERHSNDHMSVTPQFLLWGRNMTGERRYDA